MAVDGDSEGNISAIVHQVIAALVSLVDVSDVVEADIPRGVLFRNLRALPHHFHWSRNDRFDHDLAGARFGVHALLAPVAKRI